MPGYDRYSYHARRALTQAEMMARRLRHPRVNTGHLLAGVMLARGSIGCAALTELGLTAEQAAAQLAALVEPLPSPPDTTPHDAALDIALELAADESAWLGHHYIGTEHLLLGVTRTNIGNAADLLIRLNIPPDQVRKRVRSMVTDGLEEFGMQLARRDARLSELARRVMAAAEQFADHQHDVLPGMGHLLLALYREQRSPTSYLLRASQLIESRLLRLLDDEAVIALTGFDEVLAQAVDYSDRLGSHFVGTEHLLLALVLDPAGTELLQQVGAAVDDLRARVASRLAGTGADM